MKQSNKKGIKRKCCRGCGGHATTLFGQSFMGDLVPDKQ